MCCHLHGDAFSAHLSLGKLCAGILHPPGSLNSVLIPMVSPTEGLHMSFGFEMANSWAMSPAGCRGMNSPEYTVFCKNCFGRLLDRICVLWFVEHPSPL